MTSVVDQWFSGQRTGDGNVTDQMMRRLSRGGRTGVFLAVVVVTLVALFLPGWYGAALLVAIVAALGALMRRTWAVTAPQTRVLRLIILLALLVLAYLKTSR